MSCKTMRFSGLSECKKLLARVAGVMVTLKGTTFTDATFTLETTHHTGIASVTTASRNSFIMPFKGFDNTTDDIEIQTSNRGIKDKTLDPAPSMIGYVDASACDYQTFKSLENIDCEVVLLLDDNTQVGTRKSNNAIKGYRCILATRDNLPLSDNPQNSYPVYFFFRSAQEFRTSVFASPDYSMDDLKDYVPIGLNVREVTAYSSAGGTMVVQVNKRATQTGYEGLVAADFEILASDATPTVVVTAIVDDGLGQYTLTIKQDNDGTPANVTAGKYFEMQISKDDSSYITYEGETLKYTAGA